MTTSSLVLTLALAACGGGDNSDDSDKKKPDSKQTTTAAVEEADPADVATAEASVLTIKDMPAGWVSAGPEADDEEEAGEISEREVAGCAGITYEEVSSDANASADSMDFTSPDDVEISNFVGVAPNEAWTTRWFELTTTSEYLDCFVESFAETLKETAEGEKDFKFGELTGGEMPFEQYGDESIAYRFTIPMSVQGMNLEGNIEFVIVRVGRGQVQTTMFSIGDGLDPEEFAGYVQTGVDRLTENLTTTS